MNIYRLMNKVHSIRFYMTLAASAYRENKNFYWIYEQQCISALETLRDTDYITESEYKELKEQMYHIMRVYKST